MGWTATMAGDELGRLKNEVRDLRNQSQQVIYVQPATPPYQNQYDDSMAALELKERKAKEERKEAQELREQQLFEKQNELLKLKLEEQKQKLQEANKRQAKTDQESFNALLREVASRGVRNEEVVDALAPLVNEITKSWPSFEYLVQIREKAFNELIDKESLGDLNIKRAGVSG